MVQRSGTKTITAGQTSVTHTHNLGRSIRVQVTPKAECGKYWVTSDTTTFTINLAAYLDTDIDFDYSYADA